MTDPKMDEIVAVADPFELFRAWLAEAERTEPNDANAMALATAGASGAPAVRMMLLKEVDARGFVFYTNLESAKGEDLAANRRAALCFHWKTLRRQVRVEGEVEPVLSAEADAYFHSRPRGSQIGAWASIQSRPLPERAELLRRVEEFTAKFEGQEVPRPLYWSGFRVLPARIEFWLDREFRLHDRLVYHRVGTGWRTERLYP